MPALKAASEHSSFGVVPPGTFFTMAENNSGISRRYFDERYVRGALRAANVGAVPNYWGLSLDSPRTNVWLHIDFSFRGPGSASGVNGGQEIFGLYSGDNRVVFLRARPGQRQYYLSYTDTGGVVDLYGPITYTNERVQTFDIFVNIPTQTIQLYVEGTLVYSQVGSLNFAAGSISEMRITGRGTSGWFSQIILADESTVGWKVASAVSAPIMPFDPFSFPSFFEWSAHNGNNSLALQSYITNSQYDQGTFIASTSPGQKTTQQRAIPATPLSGPTTVDSVFFYGHASNTASSSINSWGWFLYRSGTVYNLTQMTVPKTGAIVSRSSRESVNPITGSPWTIGDFVDFDLGVISA